MSDKDEFYRKLKIQLEGVTTFPSDYLYKFIVPTSKNQVLEVTNLFNNRNAVIDKKKSKTGKYVSVSVFLKLKNSNEVISYYKKAEKIDGIISL